MSKVVLPNGEARIGVFHRFYTVQGKPRRGTEVIVDFPDGTTLRAESICNENDQFVRATGRKIAATRLLEQMRKRDNPEVADSGFGYDSRSSIFRKICPQFSK